MSSIVRFMDTRKTVPYFSFDTVPDATLFQIYSATSLQSVEGGSVVLIPPRTTQGGNHAFIVLNIKTVPPGIVPNSVDLKHLEKEFRLIFAKIGIRSDTPLCRKDLGRLVAYLLTTSVIDDVGNVTLSTLTQNLLSFLGMHYDAPTTSAYYTIDPDGEIYTDDGLISAECIERLLLRTLRARKNLTVDMISMENLLHGK